jgi:hypothetical protein
MKLKGEGEMSLSRLVLCGLAVAFSAGQAWGVGIPISFDVKIYQWDAATSTEDLIVQGNTGALNAADLAACNVRYIIGTAANGSPVYVTPRLPDALTPDVADRWMGLVIDTGNTWMGASLFDGTEEGELRVEITNMVWTNPNPAMEVEPFAPTEYLASDDDPLLYMLGGEGFIDLIDTRPGQVQYPRSSGPHTADPPSVQVSMGEWNDDVDSDFTFSRTAGSATSIKLWGIPDPSGTGTLHTNAPTYTAIGAGPSFTPGLSQSNPGYVPEIGISLNYRDVFIPEPATLVILLGGFFLYPRRGWRRRTF